MKLKVFIPLLVFFSLRAFADASPLCDSLIRATCAPGSYKDVSGSIKSATEMQKIGSNFREKSHEYLSEKFKAALENPENAYFKELVLSGLGLKNTSVCLSSAEEDKKNCQDNLLDGLTGLAEKQALGNSFATGALRGGLNAIGQIISDETYRKILDEYTQRAKPELSNPEMEKKVEQKIFPAVRNAIVERIGRLEISDEKKKFLIDKIKGIKYAGSNCEAQVKGTYDEHGRKISGLFMPGAFYNPDRNSFTFCSAELLVSSSEFEIAFVIGHELGHAIDPCRISRGPEDLGFKYSDLKDEGKMADEFPFPNIVKCLEDLRSVQAKKVQPASGLNNGQYGPPIPDPNSFCNNDQIAESFADWMGAEILPRYIEKNFSPTPEQYREGYANTMRTLCWLDSEGLYYEDKGVHPMTSKRVDKVLLVNPTIRKQMGCAESHPTNAYCSTEKPLPSLKGSLPEEEDKGEEKKSKRTKGVE